MNKDLPSPELLRKLLRYEPDTGKLFWLPRPVEMFSSGYRAAEGNCKNWNSRLAGREALNADDGSGYLFGCIENRSFRAHRVVWAVFHNAWPSGIIDHINGNSSDNRIVNLREVSASINSRNAKMRSHNTSGHNGVCRCRRSDRWLARITLDGKLKHLGYFRTVDEAVVARKNAEIGHGYTQRHGEPQ